MQDNMVVGGWGKNESEGAGGKRKNHQQSLKT